MKYVIEPIHTGRYRFIIMDDNDQIINGFDGGSAFIMLMLTKVIFEPEHRQYQQDQRVSSDQLAEETICRLKEEFSQKKLIPKRS